MNNADPHFWAHTVAGMDWRAVTAGMLTYMVENLRRNGVEPYYWGA